METNIEQTIMDVIDIHPLIKQCSADFPEKIKMQLILEINYDNDIVKFITEFMQFLIEAEEFETAVLVRDEFLKKI